MTDSIVVELQAQEKATSAQEPAKQQEPAKPADLLAGMVIPADLADVDPTFRGKSVRDLLEMQKNATRKIGEQGNELGVWRKLVSDLSSRAANPAPAQESTPPRKLDRDYLLENPQEAIAQAINQSLDKRLKPLEEGLTQQSVRASFGELQREHPDMVEIGNNPQFLEWVEGAKSRQADADRARQGDADAARRLLDNWKDRQSLQAVKSAAAAQEQKGTGLEAARQAVTETGGHGSAPAADTLSANDVVNTIINNPDLYRSEAYQSKLRAAAKAGNIKF